MNHFFAKISYSALLFVFFSYVCAAEEILPSLEAIVRSRPHEKISSLSVKIKTSDEPGSGTTSEVWFDIGCRAWNLKTKFPVSSEQIIDIPIAMPEPLSLSFEDIIFIRLEKKGINGWTNAPDNLLDDRNTPIDGILGPGEWKPKSIALIINGVEYKEIAINVCLKRNNPFWIHWIRQLAPEDQFVWRLRADKNPEGGRLEEDIARFTTIFKKMGISGWDDSVPVTSAKVTGVLRNRPSPGTDGYVSLDLEIRKIVVNSVLYDLDADDNKISHHRYIRIEYLHGADQRFKNWAKGNLFEIEGHVRWDTDKNGFYELHPIKPEQVLFIAEKEFVDINKIQIIMKSKSGKAAVSSLSFHFRDGSSLICKVNGIGKNLKLKPKEEISGEHPVSRPKIGRDDIKHISVLIIADPEFEETFKFDLKIKFIYSGNKFYELKELGVEISSENPFEEFQK